MAKKEITHSNFCSLGLQLIPPVFEFSSPLKGVTYEKSMKFVNTSVKPIRIQFKKRIDNKLFELRAPSEEVVLASGLSVHFSLLFRCESDTEEYKSCITVHIADEPFVIPILVHSAKPSMDITRMIDFGKVIADGRVVFRTLSVSNWGENEGTCDLSYTGSYPIKICNISFTVRPNEMKDVTVELRALEAKKIKENITVKLEGRSMLQVQMIGEVIEPNLQLLTAITRERVKCIHFGSVYYGSEAKQTAILFNNSPEPTSFVVILDNSKISTSDRKDEDSKFEGKLLDPASMFSAIPYEGYLQPYESVEICFKFSPSFTTTTSSWNCMEKFCHPPRKDYAMFITIEMVNISGSLQEGNEKNVCVDVGCIASAHPVDVCFYPTRIQFNLEHACDVVQKYIKFTNMSAILPFKFRVKLAPFIRISPKNGNLNPHEEVRLKITIKPRNVGKIKTFLPIEILDMNAINVIDIVHFEVHGFVAKTEQYVKKIGNLSANKSKSVTLVKSGRSCYCCNENRSDKTKSTCSQSERPSSVRPYSRAKQLRTIFSRIKKRENVNRESSREKSCFDETDFVRNQRLEKESRKKFLCEMKKLTASDIGMLPQSGLKPRELLIQDDEVAVKHVAVKTKEDNKTNLIGKANLLQKRWNILKQPIVDGLKPNPDTAIEKAECKLKLSPSESYMVIVAPGFIDFGDVCENSVNSTNIFALNCLDKHILLSFEVASKEIKFGCPLTMVVPPKSQTKIPVDFEPIRQNDYQRSIKYFINQHHERHIVIVAKIVKPHLILSPQHLTIEPYLTRNAQDGYHGIVTLTNPLNHPARFEWKLSEMKSDEDECAFHIFPKAGVVDPQSYLDCEVIYFLAKSGYETRFILNVRGGSESFLECSVQMDPAKVVAVDENIIFGPLAFHLPVEKTCILRNVSFCHASFQVGTQMLIPTPTVSPLKGVLSAFDLKEIKVKLCPDVVGKLDQRISIMVKNGKTVELKLNGQVEPPLIEMNQTVFNFRTVPCGSFKTIPFIISNKGKTKAELEFDLRGYKDFSVVFHRLKGITTIFGSSYSLKETPGVFRTQILSGESINADICFHPFELAAYDFNLPLDINRISSFINFDKKTSVVKLTTSKKSDTPKLSNKLGAVEHYNLKKAMTPYEITLPLFHISAVAIPQVIRLEPNYVKMSVRRKYKSGTKAISCSAITLLINTTDKPLNWTLNINQSIPPIDEPIFLFSIGDDKTVHKSVLNGEINPGASSHIHVWFYPEVPGGVYRCKIPITIKSLPYPVAYLSVEGTYRIPCITFNPPEIALPIVPLNITVHAQFFLNASDHEEFSIESVEYPEMTYSAKIDDTPGDPVYFDIAFPTGQVVESDPEEAKHTVPLLLTFRSIRPIFFSHNLTFICSDGNRYSVPVSGGSENCFVSTHLMLQQWRLSVQIVLASEILVDEAEPMMVICTVNNNNQTSRSQSSDSTFDLIKSEYQSSTDTVTVSSIDAISASSYHNSVEQLCLENILTSVSSSTDTWESYNMDPDPLTNIVERWFTVHGFPSGVYPTRIPDSLTRALYCTQMQESRTLKLAPLSKLYSTIFDSIHSLTGRTILAHIKLILSADAVERANQFYSQNDCLIRFLEAQSGCTAGIKPEYLLTYKDYLVWVRNKNQSNMLHVLPVIPELDHETFRSTSTKCWTDYLLQIFKTLVLYRISMITYPSFEIYKGDGSLRTIVLTGLTQSGSNLYSVSERIILMWMNSVYESELENLQNLTIGAKPTKRWIVNFDTDLMDSLPFAALFSAYCSISIKHILSGMYGKPVTQEQMRHNATRIIVAMEELGKEYDIKATDIIKPHPIAMLMFCAFLFERLPLLIPKTTITFKGELHSPVVKQIILTNPGTKMIAYRSVVLGPGKKNYSTTHSAFTIPPNGKFSFYIECKNKLITPEKTILQLQAKKIGPSPGISLIFTLEAIITSVTPIETFNIESPCYEQKYKILKIRNYFSEPGFFNIMLYESVCKEEEMLYRPNDDCYKVSIRFFFCKQTKIFLDPKDQTDLQIMFTPLLISKRHCFIVFSNSKIGEFIYAISGEVILPLQMHYTGNYNLTTGENPGLKYLRDNDGVIYVKCSVGDECVIELPIPFENSVLTSVLYYASQNNMTAEEYKRLLDTNTLTTTSLVDMLSTLIFNQSLTTEEGRNSNPNEKVFRVTLDCDSFEVEPTFKIVAHDLRQPCPKIKHPRCRVKYDAVKMPNILTIKITPQLHGYYISRLILKNPCDVRVYHIQLCASSKEPLALLEFSTAAHQAIAQDIPIVNTTNFEWNLHVKIEGRGFSGQSKLKVPPNASQNYSLVFWPMKESVVEGLLSFENEKDGMEYRFILLGRALHPFPFASHSLSCMARQLIKKEIEVPNITLRKFTFLVESDLTFVSGPSTISVPPLCKGIYPLEIYCLNSGQFSGTLSFRVVSTGSGRDSDGEIKVDDEASDANEEWLGYVVWAWLNITASPAAAEKTIVVTCNLLESTTMETIIRNPTRETMTINVDVVGEGLTGPKQMKIEAGSKNAYLLTYTPVRIGGADGRLIFCHPEVGEFWYNLKLQAMPPLPTYLPDINCQLGKIANETLLVKNCCGEQVTMDISCSDNLNFSIGEGELSMVLNPTSEVAVPYRFIPSGIQNFKNKFTFSSKQLGEIIFFVQGVGIYPSEIINIHISTPLGMTNSHTVNFLNPTMFDAYGKVVFKEPWKDKADSCFSIPLENMDNIFLRGRVEFQIPIFFRARHMREYKATLLVSLQRADKKLWLFLDKDKEQPREVVWTYNVFGVPEYSIDRKQRVLKCQAKKTLVESFTLSLHHCVPPVSTQGIQLGSDRFTYQIQVGPKDSFLKAFTLVTLEKESWDCKSNVAELVFKLIFTPLMTMKANASFSIRSSAGGVWKLPLTFLATEPDADNVIVIKAIDQDPRENYVEVALSSPHDQPMPFHAYFLPRSDNDFRVYPESGNLPSKTSRPIKIVITYIPKNYVKVSRAKLMVQGEDCEWLYDIQGIPPQYRPPNTFSISRMPSKTTLLGWKG